MNNDADPATIKNHGEIATPTATTLGSVYRDNGVNGQSQGTWLGPGFMGPFVNNGRLPAFHVSGDWPSAGYQAYYPSVGVRVDPEYFRTMVRVSIRLLQTLATSDLTKLAPDWGIVRANIVALTAANFQAGVAATVQADLLMGIGALVSGVTLIIYGKMVLKKLKHISYL